MIEKCAYGCGRLGRFISKRTGEMRCAPSSNSCPEVKLKKKQSYLLKYGVDNPNKSKKVKAKAEATNLKRYGSKHVVTADMFREKAQQTLESNFGVTNPSYSPEIQRRKQQTSIERIGVTHWRKDPSSVAKMEANNLAKFGSENWFGTDTFKDHLKQIMVSKYGVDNPGKSSELRQKMIATCEKRYGKNRCKSVSKGETKWLDSLDVSIRQHPITGRSGKTYHVDGFKDNTVYEYLGIFWHGNPRYFDPMGLNRVSKKTYGELYQATIDRIQDIKNSGFEVVAIWETGEPFRGTHNEQPDSIDK